MRRVLVVVAVLATMFAVVTPANAGHRPFGAPGGPVVIAGTWGPDDPQAQALVAELEEYGRLWRLSVEYRSIGGADIGELITGPDAPDILIVPQPGVVNDLGDDLVDLNRYLSPWTLRSQFGDYLIDIASTNGTVNGLPIDVNLKTLVWYDPDRFAAEGYDVPETFDELVALSDMMVADGNTPWCNYIGSGFATGWVGTDWVEDLVLGAEGSAVYDGWVDHSVLFVDPRIETAFDRYQQMIDTPGYVFDRGNMADVPFFANALILGDGDCLMHRQASFFEFFLDGAGYDVEEFDTFKFPSVDPALGEATVGAGHYAAAVTDSRNVRRIMQYMASPWFGSRALAESGLWIMPNTRFNTARYTNDLTQGWAETIQAAIKADQFRFDASDLMPPEVGTDSFWAGITDLVLGVRTVPEVLVDIDASWP